jgi:O-acetyl-ADP-ribose deacetylase (regulator of RNase III)
MIEFTKGDIFESGAEALINTVNCVGVMGKGVALQFKKAYPDNFKAYEQACKANQVVPGKMFVFATGSLFNPKYIINFPTKRHWKGKSTLEDVESGLKALREDIQRLRIQSIALPPLGCGYGGLDWKQVKPLIQQYLQSLDNVRVIVFEPSQASYALKTEAEEKPKLTRTRALYILLMENYVIPGYELTMLELQKLAYFLQTIGEPMRLRFIQHHYGPYADNLYKVLETLEGHYIEGFTGDRKPDNQIQLKSNAVEEAQNFLAANNEEYKLHMEKVKKIIRGFENPYGMELLASIHWIMSNQNETIRTDEDIVIALRRWSDRKRKLFKEEHIYKAINHLRSVLS